MKKQKTKYKGNVPPSSQRYCLVCDKIQQYQYSRRVGHSKCTKCGNRWGVNPDNAVLLHFMKKIEQLQKYIKKLEEAKNG